MVCPLCGSLALQTIPVDDFDNSLRISKRPMFVGITFLASSVACSSHRCDRLAYGADFSEAKVGLGYRSLFVASSYQSKTIGGVDSALAPRPGSRTPAALR